VGLCGDDDDIINDNDNGDSDGKMTRMMTLAKISISHCDVNGHWRTIQWRTVPWAAAVAVSAVVDDGGDGG